MLWKIENNEQTQIHALPPRAGQSIHKPPYPNNVHICLFSYLFMDTFADKAMHTTNLLSLIHI